MRQLRAEQIMPMLLGGWLCLLLLVLSTTSVAAHDRKAKARKPTKAAPLLKEARRNMDEAKKKLAAQGKYDCCIKPSCDLCARTTGQCACAQHVTAGHGACGECGEGWQAGLGAVKGVAAKTLPLLPHQERSSAEQLAHMEELIVARRKMDEAKRTLVSEGNYTCCIRGGCDSCAHAGECPCGAQLARVSVNGAAQKAEEGVCGECLDEWHAGHGAFKGVALSEVKLAPMSSGGLMSRQGSGTGWQPESTPVEGWLFRPGEWLVMLHGNFFVNYNHQAYPRGVDKAESQNWLMLMAERNAGKGRLMLRGMFSAEPLTAPHGGFPLLFQTGETYNKRPIIDAQHPHDAFMELAASYTLPLGEKVALQFYGGPVAEPALGPVAFMHRQSASEMPAAPLGHHWQDSTHIAHGVVTAALTVGKFKLESSLFRGREPDEDRFRIELGKLDSHSFRGWFLPTSNWAMQVSWGKLTNPEAIHQGDIKRMTASISYNRPLARGNWASTIVWGRNNESPHQFQADRYYANAYLFESTLNFKVMNHVYTRLELGDKQGTLVPNIWRRPGLPTGPLRSPSGPSANNALLLHPDPREVDPYLYQFPVRIGSFTFGGVRDLTASKTFRFGIGGDVTLYHKSHIIRQPILDYIYGVRPVSYRIFLRFRPGDWR